MNKADSADRLVWLSYYPAKYLVNAAGCETGKARCQSDYELATGVCNFKKDKQAIDVQSN